MTAKARATIQDLYELPDHAKAELVDGELIVMSPTGFDPSRAAAEIYVSLRAYERRTKQGFALPDNAGFVVHLPNRQSFSPDAAFFIGKPSGMKFLDGAPIFAAEVRSDGDYGVNAERAMARKRADYFAAGTLVVWDVDLLHAATITSYRADAPDQPLVFRVGDIAHAEPAVPGWTMPVDDLFT